MGVGYFYGYGYAPKKWLPWHVAHNRFFGEPLKAPYVPKFSETIPCLPYYHYGILQEDRKIWKGGTSIVAGDDTGIWNPRYYVHAGTTHYQEIGKSI